MIVSLFVCKGTYFSRKLQTFHVFLLVFTRFRRIFGAQKQKNQHKKMEDFVHLHVHTYYSILDGQSSIKKLVDKAVADGMKGRHRR